VLAVARGTSVIPDRCTGRREKRHVAPNKAGRVPAFAPGDHPYRTRVRQCIFVPSRPSPLYSSERRALTPGWAHPCIPDNERYRIGSATGSRPHRRSDSLGLAALSDRVLPRSTLFHDRILVERAIDQREDGRLVYGCRGYWWRDPAMAAGAVIGRPRHKQPLWCTKRKCRTRGICAHTIDA